MKRTPDYTVVVKPRGKSFSSRIGVGWVNRTGGISVRLDAGVSVSTPENVELMLWPARDDAQGAKRYAGVAEDEDVFGDGEDK